MVILQLIIATRPSQHGSSSIDPFFRAHLGGLPFSSPTNNLQSRRLLPEQTVIEYLTDLQRLDLIAGDLRMAFAFVSQMALHVSRFLRTPSRMDDMTCEQLLTRAPVTLTEESEEIAAAAQKARVPKWLIVDRLNETASAQVKLCGSLFFVLLCADNL